MERGYKLIDTRSYIYRYITTCSIHDTLKFGQGSSCDSLNLAEPRLQLPRLLVNFLRLYPRPIDCPPSVSILAASIVLFVDRGDDEQDEGNASSDHQSVNCGSTGVDHPSA